MIFCQNNLVLGLVDVIKINGENIKKYNNDRHFAALSFRHDSNAVISCNNNTLKMQRGSISYFPAGVNYKRTADYDDMTVIHLEVSNSAEKTIQTYVTQNFNTAQALFEEAYNLYNSGTADRYYKAMSVLYRILAFIVNENDRLEAAEDIAVYKAKQAMQTRFSNPCLSIKEIADELNISREYLRRTFKLQTGVSPKQYLQSIRLAKAQALLTSGYYSVTQVAEECGFSDEKYFSVFFKAQTGCNPSRYKYNYNGD